MTLFITLEIIMFIKGGLLVSKYALTHIICNNTTNEDEYIQEGPTHPGDIEVEHWITVCIYAFISLLRIVEYIPFAINFNQRKRFKDNGCCNCFFNCCCYCEMYDDDDVDNNGKISSQCRCIGDKYSFSKAVRNAVKNSTETSSTCGSCNCKCCCHSCLVCCYWFVIVLVLLLLLGMCFAVPVIGIYLEVITPDCFKTSDL